MTTDEVPVMGGTQPIIKLRSPANCSKEELRRFHDMVVGAGEVKNAGLRDRIGRAEVLAFLENGRETIGVGALKRQHQDYIARQFKKANATCEAHAFHLELGWVVIDEAHRGHRYSRFIVGALLTYSKDQRIYATSVSTNEPMHKTLANFKFEQDGVPWPSQERKGISLLLFVNRCI